MKLKLLSISVVTLLVLVTDICAYLIGMPNTTSVCISMKPGHESSPGRVIPPQAGPPPFFITVSKTEYKAIDTLTVTIKMRDSSDTFKGFAIQARRVEGNQDEPIGYFRLSNVVGAQIVCDGNLGNGLTHIAGNPGSGQLKSEISFQWGARAPLGHIQFRATVVMDHNRFWVAEPSNIIYDATLPIPPTVSPVVRPLPSVITTEGCGKTKGCYRNPPSCRAGTCDILATWVSTKEYVDFELVATSDGWVAIGFSDDKKMGNEDVFECAWNEARMQVDIRTSRNSETGKSNKILLTNNRLVPENRYGEKSGGQIKCQFRAQKNIKGGSLILGGNNRFHLLLAKGQVDNNGNKKIHVLEPNKNPYVSVSKVSMDDKVDITDTARYALVKLHGCLMLIGWMMCASTALILAKYYKPMWPNDRICGERVWFAVHRGCMVICLFCTVIAFIVIFVHAEGYSQMPDLPAKAHPILGIITTILCILNPLIALCKCHDKSEHRPIFNWIHWFIGTCGTVLATPTIFIGLNLPKAHVPWWATWVMVAFMLFHLIIELLLEIHGCLNASKQKYRTQEYEMRKPKDDREQEPVGKRFKKIILTLYLIVVIILGSVMVISVAAG